GHVDGNDAAVPSYRLSGQKGVEAGAAAEVEHLLARLQAAHGEWVACPSERLDISGGQPVHIGFRVTNHDSQRPSDVKMKTTFRLLRNTGVLFLDLLSQGAGVDRCRSYLFDH